MPSAWAASIGSPFCGGGQVDREEVAVGCGALDLGERGEALAQRLELLVDVVVGDGGVLDRDRDRRDVGERRARGGRRARR